MNNFSHKYFLFRLERKDGQTKDRVEVWRKNLHNLTEELMKQGKMLEELGDGASGKATDGGGELKVDYFDFLVQQISKEIQELIVTCKNVLTLPLSYQNKQKKESKWDKIIEVSLYFRYRKLVDNFVGLVEK